MKFYLKLNFQTSDDDAATMSTSGISTLDTASDVTHSKGEASPSSDSGSSDGQQKENGEENTEDSGVVVKDNRAEDATEKEEDGSGEEAKESISEGLDSQQLPESERTNDPLEIIDKKETDEPVKDHGFEDERPVAATDISGEMKEEAGQLTNAQKCRHISSSESSSDGDKLGENLTITEIARNSGI